MANINHNQEWDQIKNVLKNKYGHGQATTDNNVTEKEAWQKYQQLTGKSKNQIINQLHKL